MLLDRHRLRRYATMLVSARSIAIIALIAALTPPAMAAMKIRSADIVNGSIQAWDVAPRAGTALGNAWGMTTSNLTNATLTGLYAENIGKTVKLPRAGQYLLLAEVGTDSTLSATVECDLRVDGESITSSLAQILDLDTGAGRFMHFHAITPRASGTHRFSIYCRQLSGSGAEIHDAILQFVELRGTRLR